MAFSRSLSGRATLIARRYRPSFAYIFHDDDRKTHLSNEPQSPQKPVLLSLSVTAKLQYGVTPVTPFIQGPIFVSFFMAISTMAEKMESFKSGGAYWFTDLSTPDSLYIFPVMTALNCFCNMQGNPAAATIKNVSRVFAVLTVPFTMSFPKVPGVKKALGVPEIPKNQSLLHHGRPSIVLYTALKQTLKQAKTASQQSTSLRTK
ncbi:hypothetical protein J1N35_027593 [Gossypium stocksii]|uniref:Uncharacterized protein n=1 Tax=Gossypium stocksii TaxID=47602 RepID=A0A9D3VB29_9ROSI|nr:hypothetical protein J1N35_027593 [Gossypium stocksii]